jgi:hypothetical protein
MHRDNTIQDEDLEVVDVPKKHLPAFYRGLAFLISMQLDRTRTECIRVSRLKSLTDADALMASYDESEQLRLACIKVARKTRRRSLFVFNHRRRSVFVFNHTIYIEREFIRNETQ